MDIDAIARKWLEQRGVDLAMEGPATVRCIMDGAKMTIEGVLAAAGVPEMEAQCAAMREALDRAGEWVSKVKVAEMPGVGDTQDWLLRVIEGRCPPPRRFGGDKDGGCLARVGGGEVGGGGILMRRYVDGHGNVYFVGEAARSEGAWGVFRRAPAGNKRRVRDIPLASSRQEAEYNLEWWARGKGLKVEEGAQAREALER